jgi:hypothetical protein
MAHVVKFYIAHVMLYYMAHDMQTQVAHVTQYYMAHVTQTYMQSHMAHGDEFGVLLSLVLSGSQFSFVCITFKAVEVSTGNHATVRRI